MPDANVAKVAKVAAVPKVARVTGARSLGAEARLVELALPEGAPWAFRGGQYIIVHTGALAEGKPVKRAYSFVSADRQGERAELLVKRLAGGPGSGAMHARQVGDDIAFSGPWGKLPPPEPALKAGAGNGFGQDNGAGGAGDAAHGYSGETGAGPSPSGGTRTLVFATDTGITAALGLVQGGAFASRLPATELVWLRGADHDWVDEAFVRARVPSACGLFSVMAAPPVGDPARARVALDALDAPAEQRFSEAFLVGDGGVLLAVVQALASRGMPAEAIRSEFFFGAPPRAS